MAHFAEQIACRETTFSDCAALATKCICATTPTTAYSACCHNGLQHVLPWIGGFAAVASLPDNCNRVAAFSQVHSILRSPVSWHGPQSVHCAKRSDTLGNRHEDQRVNRPLQQGPRTSGENKGKNKKEERKYWPRNGPPEASTRSHAAEPFRLPPRRRGGRPPAPPHLAKLSGQRPSGNEDIYARFL